LEPSSTSFKSIQKIVDDWINQFEEGYWPPLSMLAAVVEETGELAREINDKEGFKKKRSLDDRNLNLELADLLFSIVCIANHYHVDLDESFKEVINKYTKRDMKRWTLKAKDKAKESQQGL
jgi:NTP pyrophosphatase (non-canonical NTP hydrolase)